MHKTAVLLLILAVKIFSLIFCLVKLNGIVPYAIVIGLNVLLSYLFSKISKANSLQRFVLVVSEIVLPFFSTIALSVFYISYIFKNKFVNHEKNTEETPEDNGFDDYMSFTSEKMNTLSHKNIEQKLREALSLQPFTDLLLSDNISQKVNVCLNISKASEESIRIGLLKTALNDPEYEVRYIANSMLNKVEKELVTEIDLLSKNIASSPHTIKNYRLRGYAKNRYALSSILHIQLKNFFLKSALDDFRYCLMNEPDNYFMTVKIAQIYMHLQMIPELMLLTEKALKLDLDDDNRNKILFYRAEGFYFLRDFEQMNVCLDKIKSDLVKYSKMLDVMNYWSEKNG